MHASDSQYVGIPWKKGGRDRDGIDCSGLAELFLREQFGYVSASTESPLADENIHQLAEKFLAHARAETSRGDIVFFRQTKTGQITHVAVYLGDDCYLHILNGCESRVDRTKTLLQRIGFHSVGAIGFDEAERLAQALRDPAVGGIGTIVLIIIAVLLTAASYFLRPKIGTQRNQRGRYGYDALVTESNPSIPLPDILGEITVAGNSPYTSLTDKTLTVSSPSTQAANKVIVLASAPIELLDSNNFNLKINGLQWDNKYFKDTGGLDGIALNPDQTKAEAVSGSIRSQTNVPSCSIYNGEHAISVPVDVRAQYDRTFPIYGFSGCAYLVFRLINSEKFPSFNLLATIRGRKCRTFDASGFVVGTATAESITADGVATRFKLAQEDIVAVTSCTVGGVAQTEYSASYQTDATAFALNKTKGYIEFGAVKSNGAAIQVTYTYYVRSWTQNPAMHVVYLLTEKVRGKGFESSRIDWAALVTARDYFDEEIFWRNANGSQVEARYKCNYAIDYRKGIQDHLRAVLDSCYSALFLSNGKFVLRARKTGSSIFSFNATNILADSFESTLIERSERANRVHVFIHPPETYNAETEVVRDNAADQEARAMLLGNDGIVEMTLKTPAIAGVSQAERLAETVLREEVSMRWLVTFKTTVKGLALEVMDVIDLSHSSQPAWSGKLCRIEDLTFDAEDRLTLKCSEYFAGAYL